MYIFPIHARFETPIGYFHAKIHCEQQKELTPIGLVFATILFFVGCGWCSLLAIPLFYWLYFVCFVKEVIHCAIDKQRGQLRPLCKQRTFLQRVEHSIIFEREAYEGQYEKEVYMLWREPFAWVNKIGERPIA